MLAAIATPDQVTAQRAQQESDQRAALAMPTYENTAPADLLARHVRSCWSVAKSNKMTVNRRLIECLRRRAGEYSPMQKAAIAQQGGADIFMMITAAKARAAKSWLADLFDPSGDRNWSADPTPIPDLPPDIKQNLITTAVQGALQLGVSPQDVEMLVKKHEDRLRDELKQEAEKRAERMSEKIEDVLVEADWRVAFDEFLDDFVTFPSAIIKGLEFRRTKRLAWVQEQNGFQPQVSQAITPKLRRVSPFRAYPSPAMGNNMKGHWLIEHHTFNRTDLAAMRGTPGYNSEAIAYVLAECNNSKSGIREWVWSDMERQTLEGREHFILSSADEIDALEWSGSLSGRTLIEWGLPIDQIGDPYDEYQMSVMTIGNYVIRAMVNPDPMGLPDYQRACWQTLPGAFWGKALPELMADCQDVCNASARSLVNNMAMSSGPQVWVEMDRLAQGADATTIFPWKIWQSSNKGAAGGPGVGFFQPASNANELLMIYERFSKYADDITGMPAYAYGSDQGAGAAKTASGLSMLMNAASKSVKDAVRNIDGNIIEPTVLKVFNWLMLDPSVDPDIKGDLVIKARGSEALVHKEQAQMRMQELLGITNNPTDMQVIGLEGRREMLSETFKSGDIPVDRIIPTREELSQKLQAQAQAQAAAMQSPQPGQPPGPPNQQAAA